MTEIKLINLTKRFGSLTAVNNLNLKIGHGEFLVLLGPSGCGKTTTLRMIAGLEKPTSGKIFFDGEDVTALPARYRDVAMVFQFYALYPTTVYKNIALALMSQGLSKREINRAVKEVAELVGLKEVLHKHVNALSVSDKQKTALARAIIRRPRLYLLDEPLTNLDPKSRVEMRHHLKRLQRELKQTVIYVTHDQVEAMSLADRIAVMNQGILQQVGKPEEVYYKPSNTFVAWFIGDPGMNLINVKIKEESRSELIIEFAGSRLTLPKEWASNVEEGEYLLGIRPEHMKIGDGNCSFRATVISIEFYGPRTILDLDISGAQIKVSIPKGDFEVLKGIKRGDKVPVKIDLSKMCIFDKAGKLVV